MNQCFVLLVICFLLVVHFKFTAFGSQKRGIGAPVPKPVDKTKTEEKVASVKRKKRKQKKDKQGGR